MDGEIFTLTLAAVLTPGGVTLAATVVTAFIAVLKNAGGLGAWIDASREPAVAFLLSAVLVIVSFATYPPEQQTIEFGFSAFLAFLGIAKLSNKVHDVVAARSLTA